MVKHINAIFVITTGNDSRLATVTASQTFTGQTSIVNPDLLSRYKDSTLVVVLLLLLVFVSMVCLGDVCRVCKT